MVVRKGGGRGRLGGTDWTDSFYMKVRTLCCQSIALSGGRVNRSLLLALQFHNGSFSGRSYTWSDSRIPGSTVLLGSHSPDGMDSQLAAEKGSTSAVGSNCFILTDGFWLGTGFEVGLVTSSRSTGCQHPQAASPHNCVRVAAFRPTQSRCSQLGR